MASEIQYQVVHPHDQDTIQLIAQWYLSEWKIPVEKTKEKFTKFSPEEFQVLLSIDGNPIATGGIYHRVGLVEREPRFALHPHWLALVYTLPGYRGKGYGAQLCSYIETEAKHRGIPTLHLFTDTAERLYTRLGWQEMERIQMGERNVVVMKKNP